ncbi:hypothetical protein [Roseicitreum antarcticum]|uniref:Uncharacterized protein n=1 Tax=Roseicitreum antarcticum TaxID=564137 RepID=A0A1H2X8P9_9RHOB|nr:hypothetical protein [Roseicitreum antarcticum]SDW89230.1 hypothetical protein SAMN04488238_104108 [Roseicitreum antarcticum]
MTQRLLPAVKVLSALPAGRARSTFCPPCAPRRDRMDSRAAVTAAHRITTTGRGR